ncbi:MAG: 2-oxoacid:acceptor oxidoreductase family protein [Bacillota bacterium]|nr:2-oxoacid:acceptor oxidoreductase family protein [Bacillota bacterium]
MKKTNIRMSGLGGQGVVTAAHILGAAAVRDGLVSTVNPFFGAEKRLAPAESYVRIDSEKIYERGEVLYPNIIMIFHPHVITMGKCYTMPFFDGLQENGIILINSENPLDFGSDDAETLSSLKTKLYYLPATSVALDVGGTELATNMAMLGALLKVASIVSEEAFQSSLAERFGGGKFVASGTTAVLDDALKSKYEKMSQLVEKNMEVVRAAGNSVRELAV